jgi:hypothetical protein
VRDCSSETKQLHIKKQLHHMTEYTQAAGLWFALMINQCTIVLCAWCDLFALEEPETLP